MKSFKKIEIWIIVLCLFMPYPLMAEDTVDETKTTEEKTDAFVTEKLENVHYCLQNGDLVRIGYKPEGKQTVIVHNNISAIYPLASGICFLKKEQERSGFWLVHISREHPYTEHKLLSLDENCTIRKIIQRDNDLFLLANKVVDENESTLYVKIDMKEYDLEDLSHQYIIEDIALYGKQLVYIVNENGKLCVQYDTSNIPVSLEGRCLISGIVNGHILTVSNEEDFELFDLKSHKSIYCSVEKKVYVQPQPGEYNVIFDAIDEGGEIDTETMYFYKVFIDGVEVGRTGTGLGQVNKTYKITLETNKNHVIELERWKLSKKTAKYVRVNNIHQPKPFRIFLHENRIMRIYVVFKDETYQISQSYLLQ